MTGTRARTVGAIVLDTGMRLNEILSLERQEVALDNLRITVHHGKGRNQRIVPMTLDLRRILYRYLEQRQSLTGGSSVWCHGRVLAECSAP
jgi:integrase